MLYYAAKKKPTISQQNVKLSMTPNSQEMDLAISE